MTTWTQSFDGQSYGNNVNTLAESWETTSTISDHADYESTYASKIWNSSGIISQSSGTYGYHESTDTDTSYLTETTETNDGFQPQFLMGSVLAVMTTTDFGAYGTVADTRSDWQRLKDTLVQAGDTFIDDALQTVVWINSELDGAWNWLGDATGVDRSGVVYDPPDSYLGGVWQVWQGYENFLWGAAKGIAAIPYAAYQVVVHPVDSATFVWNVVSNPGQVIHAVWSDFYNKTGSLTGQGEIAGEVITTIFTVGAGQAVSGASKAKTIANAAKAVDNLEIDGEHVYCLCLCH